MKRTFERLTVVQSGAGPNEAGSAPMPGTLSQPDAHTERKRKLRSAINALDRYVPDAPSSSRQALAKRLSELRDYIEQEDDEGVRVYLQDLHYDSRDGYPRFARALSRFARTIYGERITELVPTLWL